MSWICSRCHEYVDDDFEVCWSCGARLDGKVDPEFRHAEMYEPPLLEEKPQFSLGALLKVMVAFCFAFAFLASAAVPDLPGLLRVVLGFGGIGYLSLHLVSWFTTRRMQRWQRQFRKDRSAEFRR